MQDFLRCLLPETHEFEIKGEDGVGILQDILCDTLHSQNYGLRAVIQYNAGIICIFASEHWSNLTLGVPLGASSVKLIIY